VEPRSQQHRIMTTAVETVRRVINLRPKVLVEFLRRLHRRSPPNLWHFGLAVREVIAARMRRAMTGKLSATEARRMVMEKQLAAMQAHLAYTEYILNGEAASAPGAYFQQPSLVLAVATVGRDSSTAAHG
jgi:predicted RNA-binding Zn ribbon-like protein